MYYSYKISSHYGGKSFASDQLQNLTLSLQK